jgi:radical SAM protein with 4Fe4S-binding SPASM domain
LYSIKLSWRGEPLLNPDIVKMVSYAKNNGIKDVAFLTNGERLNHELTRDLVNAGLDWISISFDGMEDIYNKIRKPAKFEETVEKIKYIRQYRESVKRKKPLIRIQSIHSAIMGRENEFLSFWRDIADRVNFIADQKRSINQKDYRHDPYYICPSPWQRMCIAWDGKAVQCFGDYLEGNILGDVNEKNIGEIWRDKPFNKLRKLMKSCKRLATKPCQTCSDGGVTEEEEIVIGDRKIKAIRYVYQDVEVKHL